MKAFLRRHRAFEFLRDISRREAGWMTWFGEAAGIPVTVTVLLFSPRTDYRFASLRSPAGDCGRQKAAATLLNLQGIPETALALEFS
jgi:hypothetical protein